MISTTMYVRLNIFIFVDISVLRSCSYLWTSRVLRRWTTDQVDKAENIAWRHKSHSGSLICGANTTRCVRTELLARPAPGPAFAKIATACRPRRASRRRPPSKTTTATTTTKTTTATTATGGNIDGDDDNDDKDGDSGDGHSDLFDDGDDFDPSPFHDDDARRVARPPAGGHLNFHTWVLIT